MQYNVLPCLCATSFDTFIVLQQKVAESTTDALKSEKAV